MRIAQKTFMKLWGRRWFGGSFDPIIAIPIFVLIHLTSAIVVGQEAEFVPGELIVKWRVAREVSQPLTRIAGHAVARSRAITQRMVVYRLDERTPQATRAAIKALRDHPDVVQVQPNYIRRPFRVPNDTHYQLQWNLKAARLEGAWELTTGSNTVVVAVVDTGIMASHPDLQGRLLQGWDFISDPAHSGDNDGWDGDPNDDGTDDLASSALHGTHVAGIIGAASDNNKGMAGVDWACRILPVRALGIQGGKGRDADIVAAIRWSAGLQVENVPNNPNPARIINLSFGGPGASAMLDEAIKAAQAQGVIVVAAAGNQGTDVNTIFPAAIKDVVTVGATDYSGKRASYSNYGASVDLMAPGGDITQDLPFTYQNKTWPAGVLGTLYMAQSKTYTYHLYEGTSQAAPLVAGVVSMMLGVKPGLSLSDIRNALRGTADPSATCPKGCGTGLVNAAGALEAVINDTIPSAPPPDPGPDPIPCANPTDCPAGMTCLEEQCVTSSDNQVPPVYGGGPHGASDEPLGATIVGIGCAMVPESTPKGVLVLAMLLLLGAARRRSRHRLR